MKNVFAVFAVLAALILLASVAYGENVSLSEDRMRSIESVQKLSDYQDGLNLYTMEIFYDYDLSHLTPASLTDDQDIADLIVQEVLPGMNVHIEIPHFGCTAFTLTAADGRVYMGRNYDFRTDTSAMMCVCHPRDGYASVCFSALANLKANDPLASAESRAACLAAPFLALDGMNEKGVAVAVLTLDSEPTRQNTGKPVLTTSMLIRLVLDRAATTQEAVELISGYDMVALCGRDYHFYITDVTGNGVVVEWDCEQADRPMVVTPMPAITNFYAMYADKVLPNQKNGIYGHGMERRDSVLEVINAAGDSADAQTAWDAAKSASQLPNPESITSNTQWTSIYNLTDLTHEFVLHRHWEDVFSFDTLAAEPGV